MKRPKPGCKAGCSETLPAAVCAQQRPGCLTREEAQPNAKPLTSGKMYPEYLSSSPGALHPTEALLSSPKAQSNCRTLHYLPPQKKQSTYIHIVVEAQVGDGSVGGLCRPESSSSQQVSNGQARLAEAIPDGGELLQRDPVSEKKSSEG